MIAASDITELAATRSLRIAVSRATWFRGAPWYPKAIQVPVVAGQTVWSTVEPNASYLHVIEEPNFFGRFERDRPVGEQNVDVQWWDANGKGGAANGAAEVGSVATAKHLAGGLRQIPGLRLPHGHPESPWFIVCVPGSVEAAAAELEHAGFGKGMGLGREFPEFPGGLHIRVAWPRTENERFVRILRTAIDV